MAKKMTDDELLNHIRREEKAALDYLGGELSDQRAANMEMYLGDKTRELAPAEGRSSVVSMDVQEAVESMMPYLMKVFSSGDEVVRFDPKGAEDIQQAEQETEYINHVVMNQNNFFLVATQWFKDALINKNGYVKFWWDESENVTEESYRSLSDVELQMLLDDEEVEAIEHEYYIDESDPIVKQTLSQLQTDIPTLQSLAEQGDPAATQLLSQAPMLHDVRIKRTNKTGKVKIEPCPSEEVLVSADERSIDPNSVRFLEHRQEKTISQLREMGYDVDDDIPDDANDLLLTTEWQSRQEFDEESYGEEETGANRKVVYREAYVLVDYDGDGIAERRRICIVGKEVLNNEVCDLVPFANVTPFIMPHRHIGRALADLVKDIQTIKSVIIRNVLDNFYATNNTRHAISDKVNLDDMLISRPGGIVRVNGNPSGEIMPLGVSSIGNSAFPLIEYLDSNKENRTGITRYNQGLDANSLNKTATGINQIMSAAQAKQELIARTFAETGVKQLFLGVHKLTLQHQRKPEIVRIRNQYVPIDPSQWKTRTDMTVVVGLGTGNKQEMLTQIMNILTVQERAIAVGVVTPQNIYEACVELTKNAGFKDADKYWTNPAQQPPKQEQPDPKVVVEQQKLEFEKQKTQVQMQADAQKQQSDEQLAWAKMEADVQLAREKMEQEIQIHREKVMAEIELERERLGLQAAGMAQDAQSQSIDGGISPESEGVAQSDNGIGELTSLVKTLVKKVSAKKEIKRDKLGKVVGVETKEVEDDDSEETDLETLKQQVAQLIEYIDKPKQVVRDERGNIVGVE